MKKPVILITLLLLSIFGFGQNNKPYVIRYQSQGDIIQHNIQTVSSIHIDNLGQELTHDNGVEWSSLDDLDTVYIYRDDNPIVYNNLQTDDWEYLICNEAEQLLVYKESNTGIVAFGINNPCDSLGFFITSNDSVVSITSKTLDFHIVMKEDSVLFLVNYGETSHFYKYDYDSVFYSQDSKSCKLDNCDVLSALFSEIASIIIHSNPYTSVLYGFIHMVGTLRELDDIGNVYQLIDWMENGNHNYDNIFIWARGKEYEHESNPIIIAGISTGGNRVEGTTAYCLVDGYIKLQADIYYTGTLSANYGVCYSTSLNPTINDSKQELSVSIGDGIISQTARLPYAFCVSGLEESTTYYYRAFYEIGAIDELVYGEIKQFATEGLFEISTIASPTEGGTVTGGGRYPANTTITLTALANSGYEFTHWENGSDSNPRVITVEGDATYTAYFESTDPQGDWVDLGLPSGLLWATRNVGASSPEDYGDYFAWGETSPKSKYNWSTYQYCCNNNYYSLTKYCTHSSYGCNGYTDNLTILQPGDDAATANYGGRMPTKEEWQELQSNCTSVWTTQNGVNGRRFTGPNGNTLFLPAAGYRDFSSLYTAGSSGYYWSSSLGTDYSSRAWSFRFSSSYPFVDSRPRRCGRSVRAVRSGQN